MKKFLFFLLVVCAFAGGYYVGISRSPAPSDPVRAFSQPSSIAATVPWITYTPTPAKKTRPVYTSAPVTRSQTYVLNKKTKKFHYPSCSSVKQMKESNKVYSTDSRDDIIASGYDPCGRCKP